MPLIFDAWSWRYCMRSAKSGETDFTAIMNAYEMALLAMLRRSAVSCSLLMNEKEPAKRSIPPHPPRMLGGAIDAS